MSTLVKTIGATIPGLRDGSFGIPITYGLSAIAAITAAATANIAAIVISSHLRRAKGVSTRLWSASVQVQSTTGTPTAGAFTFGLMVNGVQKAILTIPWNAPSLVAETDLRATTYDMRSLPLSSGDVLRIDSLGFPTGVTAIAGVYVSTLGEVYDIV